MIAIDLIIILIALTTGNIQYFLFVIFLMWLSRKYYLASNSLIVYYILFFIALPTGFRDQNLINLNLVIVFTLLVSIYLVQKKNSRFLELLKWQKTALLIIVIMALIVYLPIVFSTYLGINIFDGLETQFVSNNRPSHMLGFAGPLLLSPLIIMVMIRSFNPSTNLDLLYKVLKSITFIILVLSLLRFWLNVNFIPQDYTDIRYDGNRLTGFSHPDSLGFARMLLFPLSIVASFMFSGKLLRKDSILFLILLLSLYATLSRTVFLSTTIILIVVMLYNFQIKNVGKFLFPVFFVLALLVFSGIGSDLLSRNNTAEGGINVSGRDAMWVTAINVIINSPFVGIRPGGWQIYLMNGVSWIDGSEVVVQGTHSFYLETATTWGIPILLMILSMMLYSAYNLHKTIRKLKTKSKENYTILNWAIGIQAIVIGILVHGITENVGLSHIFFILGLAFSIVQLANKRVI